jgi:hypothetical protein
LGRDFPPVHSGSVGADGGAVRARLLMKLMSLGIMTVLIVIGARSFHSASPSSPLNPGNVARRGIAGICADDQAAADAAGSPTTEALDSGLGQASGELSGGLGSSPAALGVLRNLAGGSLTCPTTTTAGP